MNPTVPRESSLSQLIFFGAVRSAGGFPFEHPLELMKVTAQANPSYPVSKVVQTIVKERGIWGFSDTMLTNFPRRILRESVRWPVIGYSHELLIKRYPRVFTREGTNSKVVTGVCVALFDSLVILPFELLMAYRVKERKRYASFFKGRFAREGIRSLYRGVGINLVNRGLVWATFMGINSESKKRFDLLDKNQAHPYLRQGVASLFVATVLTACLPADFIKVRIQMDPDLQKMKLPLAIQILTSRHGLWNFYAGALPVFVHTVFHATLGGYILDQIFSARSLKADS